MLLTSSRKKSKNIFLEERFTKNKTETVKNWNKGAKPNQTIVKTILILCDNKSDGTTDVENAI
jgi:hypothetical protein